MSRDEEAQAQRVWAISESKSILAEHLASLEQTPQDLIRELMQMAQEIVNRESLTKGEM